MTGVVRIVGVLIILTLMALAGSASFGGIGVIIGLLLGSVVLYGAFRLLRTSENGDDRFDPIA
jgi:high-affinity Fe2+/Pb2+ permease